MREIAALMREQAAAGIVPNKVNFAPARADARRVVTGAPFADGPDSTLMADFRKKVDALNAPAAEGQAAERGARGADRAVPARL